MAEIWLFLATLLINLFLVRRYYHAVEEDPSMLRGTILVFVLIGLRPDPSCGSPISDPVTYRNIEGAEERSDLFLSSVQPHLTGNKTTLAGFGPLFGE